jgi:hypothetical protein
LPLLETWFIAFKNQIRKTITLPAMIWKRGNPIQTKGVSLSQALQIQTEVSTRSPSPPAPSFWNWDPGLHRLGGRLAIQSKS